MTKRTKTTRRSAKRGLDLSGAEQRRLERMISDLLRGWRETRPTAPILPSRAVWKKGLRNFQGALPRRGQSLPVIRRDLDRVLRLSRRNDSPRFWGYVNPPGTEIGALADWLAGSINQNLSCWRSAPGATLVELQVIDWIREMVGLPRGAAGLLTSGGSMANLAGLAAARGAAVSGDLYRRGLRRVRGGPLALYASDEVHHSVDKAAAILGIGTDQVRLVPTDRRQRLDVDALRRMLRNDRRAGLKPFCVVANGGTVISDVFFNQLFGCNGGFFDLFLIDRDWLDPNCNHVQAVAVAGEVHPFTLRHPKARLDLKHEFFGD